MAREQATIKEIRPKPAGLRFRKVETTKAKSYNFMLSLINEIERLRES